MIRQREDVNEGVTTPRSKPPCKAIKGREPIIDKPRVPRVGESVVEGGAREKGRGIKRGEKRKSPGRSKQKRKKRQADHNCDPATRTKRRKKEKSRDNMPGCAR